MILSLEVELGSGGTILTVLRECIQLKEENKCTVFFKFNGVRFCLWSSKNYDAENLVEHVLTSVQVARTETVYL